MKRAKEFYSKQSEWTKCYFGEVSNLNRHKVSLIERFTGSGNKQILELGAGAGQNAVAAAELGHTITAIELVSALAAAAQELASETFPERIHIIEGDFYHVELSETFDVICYWDGFGLGSDDDQVTLFKRVSEWLKPGGSALIEVYTPWYWAQTVGKSWMVGEAKREYDFDAFGCRMIDRWWSVHDESQKVTQSLRCYSPADLTLIANIVGLRVKNVEPGGALNYDTGEFTAHVPLHQALSYVAHVVKN